MSINSLSLQVYREIERLSPELSERDIIQEGVDIGQMATRSRIAYLHFLNEDQNTIELGVWSRDTRNYCTASYDRHYPIESAGIWADSARTLQPCIHNLYDQTPHRRGLPEGHSPLLRHLGVPVLEDGRVRLLLGVGNKDSDYDRADVAVLTLVGERIWAVVRQRRVLERYLDMGQRFRHVQEIASVCGWEYDLDDDQFRFDGMFSAIFGSVTRAPTDLQQLLQWVAPSDRERVREAFSTEQARSRVVLRIGCLRSSGVEFPAELKFEFRARAIGQGLIGVGILQDVSDQLAVEDLRRRADTDALTGLFNRRYVHALFDHTQGDRRASKECFAFHCIDLDKFKAVNDSMGHAAGDEVLRQVAARLMRIVRKDDIVARVGGDEFLVLQSGVMTGRDARSLGNKVIAAISEPMQIAGRTVQVGACVGVAFHRQGQDSFQQVSAAADRALYRAKKAGGGRCLVARRAPVKA